MGALYDYWHRRTYLKVESGRIELKGIWKMSHIHYNFSEIARMWFSWFPQVISINQKKKFLSGALS